ncbi:unnamed protein product [Trifolium pratense]|uniref:Uncharacterized protein n=1 Tax=Trifolium pratense TaxID=57577 RepID=A0ACB0JGA0_TRIPR|nr:unnamed protein product [Trifolium pratense]
MFGLVVQNGMERNGMERSGTEWNGVERSGMEYRYHSIVWIYFINIHFIAYTLIWRGKKIGRLDGMGWNVFHCVPFHSIHFLQIQTMELS